VYDGDNIIAIFPSCDNALLATKGAWDEIERHNSTREADYQVRIGCALCFGEVLLQASEIMGEPYERAYHLAEDVSEVQEVLVTRSFADHLLKVDNLPFDWKLSEERVVKRKTDNLSHHNVVFDSGERLRPPSTLSLPCCSVCNCQ